MKLHALRIAQALCLSVALGSSMVAAQEQTVRVRGTIERIDGDLYVIRSRAGDELKVTMTDPVRIRAIVKASLADIKPGVYVGIAGMPQADGSQRALEVHIFPESMRGTGDGFGNWDLQTSSSMTNGNIEGTAGSVDGQTITVKYKTGEKKIVVPKDTPIVTLVPSDKSELKVGAGIFIGSARKLPDGSLQAQGAMVGRDAPPPM